MSSAVVLTCLLSLQQLTVGPAPAAVGQELELRAMSPGGAAVPSGSEVRPQVAAAGVAIRLELPDGTSRDVGVTDASGLLQFAPEVAGQHAFSANIGGVRCVASMAIAPARNRWLLAIVCVPLGLAVLWLQLRRLLAGRRSAKLAAAQSS